ncbi:extracellular triacylglycerol lipase precursor [Mycena albidolilacea]|uniref:Carboxylic ester hydrolase n=1 Tax=Mycena albidolilacea TaxID=1033008 RepID=A0AAD7EHI7_9AGAR|nr:extracellular triacylglycerol lipase precursor [Mycena albidolilacea]
MQPTLTHSLQLILWTLISTTRSSAPQVKLGQTTVIGSAIPSGEEFFGGIPYAEAPIGDLRFTRPVPKFSLGNLSTFDATSFGKSCIQPPSPFTPVDLPLSEDCLTINVFRPAGLTPGASIPVMAWIFGGSFFTGTTITFNASSLVSRSITRGTPIVYVSFNYRLGPLGFPQGPEAAARGLLNLGLRDQILALEWVQNNIAAFGGDPAKVTVFGQSAGAVSVALLYLTKSFSNLARAAIFESGEAGTTGIFDANKSLEQWNIFVNNTPTCAGNSSDQFSCLRAATTDQLLAAENAGLGATVGEFPFFPVLDGPDGIIPELPSDRLRSPGAGANIPFMSGSTLDDGTLFVAASSAITSAAQIVDQLNTSFYPCASASALQNATDTLLELYPNIPALGCPFNTGNDTFGISPVFKQAAALIGDIVIQAPRRLWSKTASAKGTQVFSYIFTDPQPENPPFLGVAHLSEIPYVYGDITVAANGTGPGTLSEIVQDYWLSFANSLNPNDGKGAPRPNWEPYGAKQRIMQLNSTNTEMIPDDFRQSQMAFINKNAALFCQ